MINVAAIRMQQFGVQFYQASLTASDIDKLVRFEVLSYGENAQAPVRGGKQVPYLIQRTSINRALMRTRSPDRCTEPSTIVSTWRSRATSLY